MVKVNSVRKALDRLKIKKTDLTSRESSIRSATNLSISNILKVTRSKDPGEKEKEKKRNMERDKAGAKHGKS